MNEKEDESHHVEKKAENEPSTADAPMHLTNNDEEEHYQQQEEEDGEIEQEMDDQVGTTMNNSSSMNTTDDEILLEDGLPASIPLSSLAGPALVMSPDLPMSGEEIIPDEDVKKKRDNFDWAGRDDEEEDETKKGKSISQSSLFICLSKNASYIAWTGVILFALILIAVDVAIFVVYRDNVSMVSYNLEVWFTFLAFMWCIGFLSQVAVELVPWGIKKLFGYLRPQSTEVLRMRLSYFMALRSFIKLVIIAAWTWGCWAFLTTHVPLPAIPNSDPLRFEDKPSYIGVFYSIWECVFFASVLLFVEKFFLQLIVTSFHKKAYGSRIEDNDKALKILDKLKKVKRKNPQDFIFNKIKRKAKNITSRSQSMDENDVKTKQKPPTSIMNNTTNDDNGNSNNNNNNVRFPSQNVDTLIAIPPLDDQHEEQIYASPDDAVISTPPPKYRLTQQIKNKIKSGGRKTSQDSSQTATHNSSSDKERPAFIRAFSTGSTNIIKFGEDRSSSEHPRKNSNSSSHRPRMISRDNTFLNTTAIPGKLLKGGYNKIKSKSNGTSKPGHQQSTSQQAKVLAKRIYHNLMGPDPARDYMVEADLYPYFRTQEEAAAAFRLFDIDGNGDISKRELRSGCIRIYRERKNLARSMRDLSQATGKMDIILMVIFLVIWIIILLAAFGVNVGTELMPLWSAFIAASFVFGNSAKEAFDSIIFVFVTHPFDAGDRVFIGTDNFVVDNVGLLVTTFIKWDGSVVYVKNAILAALYIINIRRTGPMGETVPLNVNFNTPTWKLHQLREHMFEFCNQFPKMYVPNCVSATVVSFENQNKINLSYYFSHTENWQDPTGRMIRHNNFMLELKDECERLGIDYTLPRQPLVEGDPGVNDRHHPLDIAHLSSDRTKQEGLHQRHGYRNDYMMDDEINDGRLGTGGSGTNGGAGNSSGSPGGDAGASAGAAAAMMFGAIM
ncbi:uncharacterized protein BX664DRAFT_303154 [Halteromyces radiatus]|uniref:uncharacterized protein n=1 Tax=Halteromyces radiatus TaxID=101107 RepID=UPI00221F4352|nr:uncharacterized protein BX664DRAFT_303154 [Halteromyces radiatus]KAI8079990.1 hypothetical protein BX664DRAFT_303154 [Halteromyces radiatus]